MGIHKDFLEVLAQTNLFQVDSIKLLDGCVLKEKHVLMHEINEAALYRINTATHMEIHYSSIIKSHSYPQDYQVSLIYKQGDEWVVDIKNINEMQDLKKVQEIFFIYFPPMQARVSMRSFEELIAYLRSEEGCPWDREQTHLSLRPNLLEETYEVLETIDNQDDAALKEELGDLLLQIFLHSQIASERGAFDLSDVVFGIHQKITSRHPHVFKDWDVKNPGEVMRNWEVLKSREREKKGMEPSTSILASVPRILPALSLAQEYQKRAARVGFDWPDITPVIEKVKEEFSELLKAENKQEAERELGDLLFAMVNLVRWYGEDSESVLRNMNNRFFKRFNFMERMVSTDGKKLSQLTLAEMDILWDQAKKEENRET